MLEPHKGNRVSLEQDDYFKYESQHQALRLAVRSFGSVQALCDAVNKMLKPSEKKLTRECLNHWKNRHQKITYSFAMIISKLTGIPISQLAPFYQASNELIAKKQGPSHWPVEKIVLPDQFYDPIQRINGFIVIDSEGVLISGSHTLKAYQAQANKNIPVVVVDLKSLMKFLDYAIDCKISKPFSLLDFDFVFSVSQKSAISLAFDRLLKNQHSYPIDFRTDPIIAKVLGFDSTESLILAKKIYLKAPTYLIEAVDCAEISIKDAGNILEKSKALKAFELAQKEFSKTINNLFLKKA